jgi:hypothetical protein
MRPREFFINPADYGLPTRDELVAYRIWDNHFHGFASENPIEQYERNHFFVERMGIERFIAQEIGGTPRLPGGDNGASESTPMDLAKLHLGRPAERCPAERDFVRPEVAL